MKVLDTLGRVQMILGRRGAGPGEFQAPFAASFTPTGRIVVVDPENARVSIFSREGGFVSSFPTLGQDPRVVSAVTDSAFVVGGLLDVGRTNLLFAIYSADGARLAQFHKADSMVFATDLVVDQPWLARGPGGDFVGGLSLLPQVHRFSAGGRELMVSNAEPPPGWRQLTARSKGTELKSLRAARDWVESATFVQTGGIDSLGSIYVAWGDPESGEGAYLGVLSSNLQPVRVFSGLPGRLVHVGPRFLVVVAESESRITLRTFHLKP